MLSQGLAYAEVCEVVLTIQFSTAAGASFPEDIITLPWEMLLPVGIGD